MVAKEEYVFSCESVTFSLAINMCSVRGEPGSAACEGQTNGDRMAWQDKDGQSGGRKG